MFKESMKWLGIIIVFIVALTFVGAMLKPLVFKAERAAVVNSHQYIEGRNQAVKVYQAQLSEIEVRLAADPENVDLQAQAAFLRGQISSNQ